MASEKSYVSISELKEIADALDRERYQIYNTYRNKVLPVLESSNKCFYVAGLNTSDIITNFNTTFSNVNSRLTSLVNVLNNDVVAKYNEIAATITQLFNKDFGSRLRELLNI